jgi:lysozyme
MRRAFLLASVAALAGCIGAAPVDETESGLSVCAKGPVVKGVDVSHYDGTIDWAAAHGAGIAFAFMKATESTGFADPQFAANWKNAGANGVIRGAYHFFRASADATAQADYFVQQAGVPAAGDLPLTIDLETLDGVAAATVASDALTFLARVEAKSGRKPIVYTSSSFLTSIGSPAGFGAYTLWVANWQVSCPKLPSPPWSDWTFWQDSATATVNGIPATAVDGDQFNGTLADLQAFAGGGSGGGGGGGGGGSGGGGGGGGGGGSGGGGGGDPGNGTDDGGKADSPGDDMGTTNAAQHGGCSAVGRADAAAPTWFFFAAAATLILRRRARALQPIGRSGNIRKRLTCDREINAL